MLLKLSTARNISFFVPDSTDSLTGKTGLTPTVTLSKNGAAFGAAGGTVTELTLGWYYLAANTTDTGTLGDLLLHVASTASNDPVDMKLQVTAELPGVLAASTIQAIWDALTSALTTANSIGKLFTDNINATISSRSTLTAANVWDALTSGLTTAGSIGKLLVDNINTTLSSIKALLPTALVGGRIDASVGSYQSGLTPLQPTVAGRTLDVSAGGEGGVDWANVGSPTTTNNLSGTSVNLNTTQIPFKKNTAVTGFTFPMYDTSGLLTTGYTVTAQRSIDGGAFSACTNAVVELSSGYYKITLSAADLNGDTVTFKFTASGAAPSTFTAMTQ